MIELFGHGFSLYEILVTTSLIITLVVKADKVKKITPINKLREDVIARLDKQDVKIEALIKGTGFMKCQQHEDDIKQLGERLEKSDREISRLSLSVSSQAVLARMNLEATYLLMKNKDDTDPKIAPKLEKMEANIYDFLFSNAVS